MIIWKTENKIFTKEKFQEKASVIGTPDQNFKS